MTWLWLAVVLFSLVVEILTRQLVSIWFAAAGAIVLLLSYSPINEVFQIAVFLILSIVFLILVRRWTQTKLKKSTVATNVDSFIGRRAIVTETVDLEGKGRVRIDGVEWVVILQDEDEIIQIYDVVEITAVEGAKFVVKGFKKH